MSYDDQSLVAGLNAYTPMIFDVIALQAAYGEGAGTTGSGNDTIVAGTVGYRTYFDTGGTDTIDLDSYQSGAYLNMGVTISGATHLVGIVMSVTDAKTTVLNGGNPSSLRWFYGEYENSNGSVNDDLIIGNDLDNIINGGDGDDDLSGGSGDDWFDWEPTLRGGNDEFEGGLGDDIYVVDSLGDLILENAFEGIDTVFVGFNYSIWNTSLENIKTFSNQLLAVSFSGNDWSNILEGGAGNDSLFGYEGSDTLAGGAGNDLINGGTGADTVKFTGAKSDYKITQDASGVLTVLDNIASRDGTDKLSGVEFLSFSDGIIAAPNGSAPTVTTFSPVDEATGVAVSANIVVTFNEAIQRGTGSIMLKTSAGAVVATYDAATSSNLSISGSTLTINPTADLGYSTGYKVEFAAGTIKDIAGNSYAGVSDYNFATVASTIPPVAPTVTAGAAGTIAVTIGSDATTAKLFAGTTDITAKFSAAKVGSVVTFTPVLGQVEYTSQAVSAKAVDASGNVSAGSTALSYTFDNIAPAAPTIAAGAKPGSISVTSSSDVVAFMILAGGVDVGEKFTVEGQSDTVDLLVPKLLSFDGKSQSITVVGVDKAGNASAASGALTYAFDNLPPAAPNVKVAANGVITVALAAGSDAASTKLLAGTAEITSKFTQAVSGSTVTYTPIAGKVELATQALTVTAADAAKNVSAASTALSYTFDNVVPAIAITGNRSNLTVGQTATINFVISESVADFVVSDITVSGGTLSNFSGSGTNYTATFTPTANSTTPGVVSVGSNKFSDSAGNFNADGSDANNTVSMTVNTVPADTTPPTIAISSSQSSLTIGQTATLTFAISESVSDFVVGDITVSGGTLSNFAGSGTSYSATFTPTSNSRIGGVVSVASGKFSDAAGNLNVDGADANNTVTISVNTVTTATKTGTTADDSLMGSAINDAIYGLAGNDTLDGGLGADTLIGGAGNDTHYIDNAGDSVVELAGEGTDIEIASLSVYLPANVENLALTGTAYFGVGNTLDNVITGSNAGNLLLGGVGNDTITGGDARDAIFGESGNDSISGGGGIDYLIGGTGNDTIDGGTGADEIYGEDGNDSISGGSDFQTDILVGGAGNDTIDGGSAWDLMYGNAGDDTFYASQQADWVFENAAEGYDTVIADSPNGYYLFANVEALMLIGTTPFGVGNELDNVITGNAIGNVLLGGAGNDTLDGGAGQDILWGEAGSDTFLIRRGTGMDIIADFTPGTDRLDVRDYGFMTTVALTTRMTQVGTDISVDLGGGDSLILMGVKLSSLGATDLLVT